MYAVVFQQFSSQPDLRVLALLAIVLALYAAALRVKEFRPIGIAILGCLALATATAYAATYDPLCDIYWFMGLPWLWCF